MNEHFVAIEVGSLYARGRERNMPAAEGSQDGGVKREIKPVATKLAETNVSTPENKQPNQFLEKIRGFFDIEPDEPVVHPKVSWQNAHLGAKIIAGIRSEEPTTASADEIQRLGDDLIRDGRIPFPVVSGMDRNEIIASYPLLLQHTVIDRPKNSDFEYPKADPKRRAEELAANLLVEKAASTAEKDVTPEKVGKFFRVKTEELVKSGGDDSSSGSASTENAGTPSNASIDKGEGSQLVYLATVPLGKDLEREVGVYRKADGTFVMEGLPITKYDWETISKILYGTGISKDLQKPANWDKLDTKQKIDLLRGLGLDTLQEKENLFGGAAPAAGAVPTAQNSEFKRLITESFYAGYGQAPVFPFNEIEAEILRRVHSDNPDDIYPAARGLQEFRASIEYDPALIAQLDLVINPVLQQEIYQAKEAIDAKYFLLLDPLTKKSKDAILKDIDEASLAALVSLKFGQDLDGLFFKYFRAIKDGDSQHPEPPGLEGIRSWYSQREAEKIRFTKEVEDISAVKADPFENIKSVERTMRFFERSESTQELGLARQRMGALLTAVEESVDPDLSHKEKARLRRSIDAWNVKTPMHIIMNRNEGDPHAVGEAAGQLTDETEGYYYERFEDVKDVNGNSYMVDIHGAPLNINLLGAGRNAVRYKTQVERYFINHVQEMTKASLDLTTANPDRQILLNEFRDVIARQRVGAGLPPLTPAQMDAELQARWVNDKNKIKLIDDWYLNTTLLGADEFEPNSSETRRLVRMEETFQTVLRDRLTASGVAPTRINDLLGTLQNPLLPYDGDPASPTYNPVAEEGDTDLTQALQNLSINEEILYGSITVQDRVRVYNFRGEQIETVHNWENPDLAREIDHMPDYYLADRHGDPRTNKVLREHLDRKQKSWMLGSNSTEYRTMSNMKKAKALPAMSDAIIEHEITAEMTRLGMPADSELRIEVEAYIILDLVNRGYNPNAAPGTPQLDLFNIDYGRASKAINNYVFTDNMHDREAALKMYREALKEYQKRPSEPNFLNLIAACYSSRPVRIEPFTELMLGVQEENGQHWKETLDAKDNMSNTQMETLIQTCIGKNYIGKERAERVKDELLATTSPRAGRQLLQLAGIITKKDLLRPGFYGSAFWDFWKTLVAYLTSR